MIAKFRGKSVKGQGKSDLHITDTMTNLLSKLAFHQYEKKKKK